MLAPFLKDWKKTIIKDIGNIPMINDIQYINLKMHTIHVLKSLISSLISFESYYSLYQKFKPLVKLADYLEISM